MLLACVVLENGCTAGQRIESTASAPFVMWTVRVTSVHPSVRKLSGMWPCIDYANGVRHRQPNLGYFSSLRMFDVLVENV
jgi:hypothetical protein